MLAVAGAAVILTALAAVLLFPSLRRSGQREPLSADQKLSRAEERLKHYDQGANLGAAISDLNEIAPSESDNAQYWGKRGWAHWLVFERDDTEEALNDADHFSLRALNCNDKNPDGHLVQGLVAKARHQWLEATNHLLSAKNLTHSVDGLVMISLASACRAAGDRSNGLVFAELAEQNTGDRWEVFDRIGTFRYITQPRGPGLDRALTNFQQAVRLAKESPLAHRHLGQILLLRQAYDQASKELEQSLKLSRTALALGAVGTVYYSAGQRQKALEYHSQAIQADPGNYIYQVAAGLDLWEPLSSFPEADEHFAKALLQIGTLPDLSEEPLPLAYQGLCHAALRQKEEARKELALALSKAALDHNVLRVIRCGYQILGDRPKANEIEKLLDQNVD